MKYRRERDSMGEMDVPKHAYYGIHSQRSLENFNISRSRWHPVLIRAIVLLKRACVDANRELRLVKKHKAGAIRKACDEILMGKLHDQFPLDVFQAGSGTSTNMNVNEVIANRAAELLGGKRGDRSLVHPNDDVNKGQSTNNVIPSSMRVASLMLVAELLPAMKVLHKVLLKKATQFQKILKSGRTHLQDAVPIRLGQEFGAYATAVGKHIVRLEETKKYLKQLGIGGNAVGTGLNTHAPFRKLIIKHLNKNNKVKFSVTPDGIESTQFLTDMLALSSVLKLIAVDMNKIANDLRLLSSGPKTGLGEITLPAVEPGSSIMPGKINPSIAEAVNMACYKVMGNDTTLTLACTAGNLDLNTHMPLIGNTIVESLEILTRSAYTFANKCVKGITANKEQCRYYVEHSAALATALNPYIGYDAAAAVVKESLKTGKTIQQLVVEKGLMTQKQLDAVLVPEKLTRPNLK